MSGAVIVARLVGSPTVTSRGVADGGGGMRGIHPPLTEPGGISPALFKMDRLMLAHLIAQKKI